MREIKSRTNETIKKIKSLERKKYRDAYGLYMVEGKKAIEEALKWEQPFECLVVADAGNALVQQAEDRGTDVILVPPDILCTLADAVTPQGEIACLRKQVTHVPVDGGFYVALDDVADPKNVGAIIRTADAMGADGLLLSEECADFYGPKVQRAAMGSTFHLPMEVCDITQKLGMLKRDGIQVIAGCLGGTHELPTDMERICIVIGNEAHGISDSVRALADTLFEIPIPGNAESLNASVAAGILLYEASKRSRGKRNGT